MRNSNGSHTAVSRWRIVYSIYTLTIFRAIDKRHHEEILWPETNLRMIVRDFESTHDYKRTLDDAIKIELHLLRNVKNVYE